MSASMAYSNYPIVAALVEAEKILGRHRQWHSVNPEQADFITNPLSNLRNFASALDFIESLVSWNAADINKFLKDRGLSITIPELRPLEFGMASVLDLLVEWAISGEMSTVRRGAFPAAKLSEGTVSFFEATGHKNPIVRIDTKTVGMYVYMSIADSYSHAQMLAQKQSTFKPLYGYGGLVFPMVNLDVQPDVSWLIQMHTVTEANQNAKITNAVMQAIIKANHLGARAKVGFAGSVMMESMPSPDLIIDEPFALWFAKDDTPEALVTAHVAEDSWSNPGSL